MFIDMFTFLFVKVLVIFRYEYANRLVKTVKNIIESIANDVSTRKIPGIFACSILTQFNDSSMATIIAHATAMQAYIMNTFLVLLSGKKFPVCVIYSIVSETI